MFKLVFRHLQTRCVGGLHVRLSVVLAGIAYYTIINKPLYETYLLLLFFANNHRVPTQSQVFIKITDN